MLEHAMPIAPGTQVTLDDMPAEEALRLVRNILCAVVRQMPNSKAHISGSQMVCAQPSVFKMQIQPSACGQYIDFINLEIVDDGSDDTPHTDTSADRLAGPERNA